MSFFKKITKELENLGIGGDKDKKEEEHHSRGYSGKSPLFHVKHE